MFGFFNQENKYLHSTYNILPNNLQQNPVHNGHANMSCDHVNRYFTQLRVEAEPMKPIVFSAGAPGSSNPQTHSRSGAPTYSVPSSRHKFNSALSNELKNYIFDRSKELSHATFLAQRAIVLLSQVNSMDARMLTDTKAGLPDHIRSLNNLVRVISEINKLLFENKVSTSSGLYEQIKGQIKQSEVIVSTFQEKLNEVDMIINRENITSTHLHAFDTNSLVYKHFSGKFGISEPHIFEFLETLESNFKIARI